MWYYFKIHNNKKPNNIPTLAARKRLQSPARVVPIPLPSQLELSFSFAPGGPEERHVVGSGARGAVIAAAPRARAKSHMHEDYTFKYKYARARGEAQSA